MCVCVCVCVCVQARRTVQRELGKDHEATLDFMW